MNSGETPVRPGLPPLLVDARGLKCPLPALLTARAARRLPHGGQLTVLTDDRAAAIDLRHLCAERGWHLLSADETGDVRVYLIAVPALC